MPGDREGYRPMMKMLGRKKDRGDTLMLEKVQRTGNLTRLDAISHIELAIDALYLCFHSIHVVPAYSMTQ
jgi:hypothetical protein